MRYHLLVVSDSKPSDSDLNQAMLPYQEPPELGYGGQWDSWQRLGDSHQVRAFDGDLVKFSDSDLVEFPNAVLWDDDIPGDDGRWQGPCLDPDEKWLEYLDAVRAAMRPNQWLTFIECHV